jgi:hypothetical protein
VLETAKALGTMLLRMPLRARKVDATLKDSAARNRAIVRAASVVKPIHRDVP